MGPFFHQSTIIYLKKKCFSNKGWSFEDFYCTLEESTVVEVVGTIAGPGMRVGETISRVSPVVVAVVGVVVLGLGFSFSLPHITSLIVGIVRVGVIVVVAEAIGVVGPVVVVVIVVVLSIRLRFRFG